MADVVNVGTTANDNSGDTFRVAWQAQNTWMALNETRTIQIRLLDSATAQGADTTIGGDFRIPYAVTVTGVGAYCDTAGTTGVFTVDIHEAGTTILSTKITVDSTEKSSVTAAAPAVISDAAIAADAILTFDLDGVQTTPANGLVVWMKVTL